MGLWTFGVMSRLTPVSRKLNCVLTSGFESFHSPHSGLKAAGRVRDAVTDLQRGFIIIDRAHLRLLENAAGLVTHQRLEQCPGAIDREIAPADPPVCSAGSRSCQSVAWQAYFHRSQEGSDRSAAIIKNRYVNSRRAVCRKRRRQIANPAAIRFHYDHVNNHFRPRFVQILDQFFGQRNLIGRPAHQNRILCVVDERTADFSDGSTVVDSSWSSCTVVAFLT